jgi:imidazolonepropionase-like amidohydrolase
MVLVIKNATLIDGTGGPPLENSVVIIKKDIISAVGGPELALPAEAEIIEAEGKTVLPGLIDCHMHLSYEGHADSLREAIYSPDAMIAYRGLRNAQKHLDAGFTSVRNCGEGIPYGPALKEAIATGLFAGPRIFDACYFISQEGGSVDKTPGYLRFETEYRVSGAEEARKAVRTQLKYGADFIKIATTGAVLDPAAETSRAHFTLQEVQIMVDEAHRAGKVVASHAHGLAGIKTAVEGGVHSIEHGSFLDKTTAEAMKAKGIILVPTFRAIWGIVENGVEAGVPEYAVEKAKMVQKDHRKAFNYAKEVGTKIALGTDAGTPFNTHGDSAKELELMVEAGMTEMEALVAATKVGAEVLTVSDQLGTIEPGKLADMIVVDGNPLSDITVLQNKACIETVIKNGVITVDRQNPS